MTAQTFPDDGRLRTFFAPSIVVLKPSTRGPLVALADRMTRVRDTGTKFCAYFMYGMGVLLLAFSAVVLLVPTAAARELSGVSMPDRTQVGDKTLVLNGMGVREATILNIDVYIAGLYLESKSANAREIIQSKQVKRLAMQFVRNVDRDDITKAFIEGFKKNSGGQFGAVESRVKQLVSWLPAFRKGDVLVLTYTPNAGVEVAIGRGVKGTIRGDDFARALWSVWLGPKPPTADLKTQLLGGK